jgi:hypothetical protein
MSAPQMAQEFAGLAERKTLPVPARVSSVNLFLPARVFFPLPRDVVVSPSRADVEKILRS